jgi:protein kinase A
MQTYTSSPAHSAPNQQYYYVQQYEPQYVQPQSPKSKLQSSPVSNHYSSHTVIQDVDTQIIYSRVTELTFSWERLECVRTLNNGSFGSVVLFVDKVTGEQIAVKIMSKAHIIAKSQVTHIANERVILSSLDHPFIIKLFGTNQDVNHIYMAMRYECGGELFTYMGRYKKLPDSIAKFYAAELLLVIEYLHAHNIAHRDIKLENSKF